MDEVTCAKNKFRMDQWAELIRQCQASGMKVNDWCAANGVTHDAYYYWLRKLRKAAMEQTGLTRIPNGSLPVSFKKLEVTAPVPGAQAAVIVRLPSATVEVQDGASRQTVEAVLLALKATC